MRIIIILIQIVVCQNLLASGHNSPGDTLYVWAYNGLILRSGPSVKNARQVTIPYGDYVVVLPQNSKRRDSIKELGGFLMHGDWIKVQYGNAQEGFVFDGYLSRYPALKDKKTNEWWEDVFQPYASGAFGPPKHNLYRNKKEDGCNLCYGYKDIFKYPNGAVAAKELLEGDGGLFVFTVEIKDFSLEEAYLMFVLNPVLWRHEHLNYTLEGAELQIKAQSNKQITATRELTTYEFELKNGSIFIKFWSSC